MILITSILLGLIHFIAIINYTQADAIYSFVLTRLVFTLIYNYTLKCDCIHSSVLFSAFRDVLIMDIYYMFKLNILDSVAAVITGAISIYMITHITSDLKRFDNGNIEDHLTNLMKSISYFMMTIAHLTILSSFQ